jgi:hypothetical protein
MFQANCSPITRTTTASLSAGNLSTRLAHSGTEKPTSRMTSATNTIPSSQLDVWLVTPL